MQPGVGGVGGVLTRDGAKVEVVPYDLLELVIQRALLELQTEVVTEVRVQYFTCNKQQQKQGGFNATCDSVSWGGLASDPFPHLLHKPINTEFPLSAV